MKTEVTFKPYKRTDSKFAYGIYVDGQLTGFVHWIESANGKICRINRPDMVMSPTWGIEQAEAECAWLTDAYLKGEIE